MRKGIVAFLAVSLILPAALTGLAVEFAADFVQREGQSEISGKIYVKGPRYRLELRQNGESVVVLVDRQTRQTTVVDGAEKTYVVLSNSSVQSRMNNPFESARFVREKAVAKEAGEEQVNGVPCRKIGLFMDDREVMTVWESKELDFPMRIRLAGPDGDQVELGNVRREPVSDGLFRIPEGFTAYKEPAKSPAPAAAKRPAITGPEEAELPVGRRIAAGGELRVKMDPGGGARVTIVNEQGAESACRVTPMSRGRAITAGGAGPRTLTVKFRDADSEMSISGDARADEVVLAVEKGLIRALVERPSLPFEKVMREAMFLMGQGRGLLVDPGQPLWLKMEGDNQDGDSSEVKITFFRDAYKDPIGSESVTLANKQAREWSYAATDRVRSIEIEVKPGGGIKAWLDQSGKKAY